MHPLVDLVAPAVELQLEVGLVREPPSRLEIRAHEPVRALQHPFGLRVGRRQDHPTDAELPAETGKRIGRPASAGVDRALPVPDQFLGQHPDPLERPAETPEHVRRLFREHQRARDDARPTQLDGHHVAAARLPVADRDRLSRLPQVALHQLPRAIHRTLERAPYQEPRPHLPHIVVEDVLPPV